MYKGDICSQCNKVDICSLCNKHSLCSYQLQNVTINYFGSMNVKMYRITYEKVISEVEQCRLSINITAVSAQSCLNSSVAAAASEILYLSTEQHFELLLKLISTFVLSS